MLKSQARVAKGFISLCSFARQCGVELVVRGVACLSFGGVSRVRTAARFAPLLKLNPTETNRSPESRSTSHPFVTGLPR
jgi:hypothetical protein